jgi:NhaP-type Na+/H+ or K+/H+ antiporter
VGWAGMRGVISLASALAIPVTLADGKEFPERDLVLFISFVVILVTLVFQGLSLPWIIKKLKLREDIREVPVDVQAQQIHLKLMKLSLARLSEKHGDLLQSNMLVKTLKQKLENEVGFTRLNIESLKITDDEREQVREFNQVLLDIGEFQHQKLSSLGMHTKYDEDVIQREEARIDLEQNKIG